MILTGRLEKHAAPVQQGQGRFGHGLKQLGAGTVTERAGQTPLPRRSSPAGESAEDGQHDLFSRESAKLA